MLRTLGLALLFAAAGCYSEIETEPAAVVTVGDPTLAVVAPGVEVFVDSTDPTFFVDGLYWRWYGGYWYRSTFWDGGWVIVTMPPPWTHRIGPPGHYGHYRPPHGHPVRRAPRPVHGHGHGRH